ncbi:transcriptional regulator Spx [Lacticaseibacillus baoqingensis]|uniref:Transcriptional regulator Spx n=1 Tax=Lacticaseibacillus baoqingensis TaxID=2486013 RepID=A0ABW4E2E9_9LACO|nr:transcriptional regulator Spx [Lacticaseibacillus baoqingensis]
MVVTLYTAGSCTSSRKARNWLLTNHIPFDERNLDNDKLSRAEVKRLLRMTETGTQELLSVRSKAFLGLGIKLDDLTTEALISLIIAEPRLLRRPILIDDKRMQVGYHEDEIRRFLPRGVRALALQQAQLLAGF